ncbi:NOP8 [Candida theae]|uniref:NOP8 n=1 Tax=Candida theae TaxID=1198502 RepID=A0AAD5BJ51_9ASCO|nr:NOP8 [Candida theae]KAI5967510.1 NOP8 [Candida theae]
MSDLKEYRIHIGNISPKLKDNSNLLEQRIRKFDIDIKLPLEFHTKPIETKYFAYTTILASSANFSKLKASLHGVQFMGLKLTISIAKPSYQERFHTISQSKLKQLRQDELKQEKIANSRLDRIRELHTSYPTNPITSTIVTTPKPSTFSLSQHIFNNTSANTKNPPPTHRLNGSKSYGATLDNLNFKYRNGSAHSVVKGAHRRHARKDVRSQTLRILVNGELKNFKFYKTKLWGVEKNKTVRDMTWRYDAKMGWKSGDDHLIEGVAKKTCGINGEQALRYGEGVVAHGVESSSKSHLATSEVKGEDGDDEIYQETSKNKAILASLLTNYDFGKPVDLEEDKDIDKDEIEVDSKGRKTVKHYDYEVEGKAGDEDDEDEPNVGYKVSGNFDMTSVLKDEELVKPIKEVYYDEDDEGNDLDFDTLKPMRTVEEEYADYRQERPEDVDQETAQQQNIVDDEDEEDNEFMPTFGTHNCNNTETLRSLFNPSTSDTQPQPQQSTFKLALSDDDHDIDETKIGERDEQRQLLKQIQQRKHEEFAQSLQQQRQNQFGLFWPHFDSPFLSTQSQLAKIGNIATGDSGFSLPSMNNGSSVDAIDGAGGGSVEKEGETDYEKWFWSVRGEFTRECKRRKRDLMRIMRKKRN